jgi:hypothetical protein
MIIPNPVNWAGWCSDNCIQAVSKLKLGQTTSCHGWPFVYFVRACMFPQFVQKSSWAVPHNRTPTKSYLVTMHHCLHISFKNM